MRKKIFCTLLIALMQFFCGITYAKTIKVVALTEFDSKNPPKNFAVELKDQITISPELTLYSNYVLKGYIYATMAPKRLKQDATFIFIPTSYKNYENQFLPLTNVVTKYTTKISPKEIIVNGAYCFGTVPILITSGVLAAQGAIQNEDHNVLKSSAMNVYENSPLSLIEKGDYLNIKAGQEFLLNFVIIKEEKPNYEFSPAN